MHPWITFLVCAAGFPAISVIDIVQSVHKEVFAETLVANNTTNASKYVLMCLYRIVCCVKCAMCSFLWKGDTNTWQITLHQRRTKMT